MRIKTKESGFSKYLSHALKKDKQARTLFFAELMKEPVTVQLKILRHFRGFSQLKLSRKVKLAQPEVARLERIESNPRARTLERVAKGLGAQLEIIPQGMLAFIATQQLRAQGELYFYSIAHREAH